MDQLHANELEAQRRLTELFKAQASDAEKKCEEMREAVTSMQEMLKQGHERMLASFYPSFPSPIQSSISHRHVYFRCNPAAGRKGSLRRGTHCRTGRTGGAKQRLDGRVEHRQGDNG